MKLLCCCCCWRMAPNSRMTRKWEIFAGRNKFYCDGYLMTAPNTGIFYLTVFLITGTSALFFAFDCPYLATNITSAIPMVGAILYVFTMASLLRTTFTDPGVIPRALQDEVAYIDKQIEVPNSLNSPTYRPPPRTKEILVKGQTVKLKYCFTCKIFRPPRASHCSLCDNCVDRFDHHCPWVGNCVGKRNYRFFYMFIISLAFLAVFIFSFSVTHLILLGKGGDEQFTEIVKKAPFSVLVTLICFFSIWSVIGLAGFHTYLTTSDQTTNEDIKGSFSKGAQQIKNPYSHGNLCSNCCYILCGPMTPSLIDRRGEVTEEYMCGMQPPIDNNRYIGNSQSIVLQPISNNAHNQKTKYYDNELDSGFLNSMPGKYRQRSYDNLKTDNSNSVANLVENENPTSIQSVPNDDNLPNSDNDNLDNLAFANMKGSYNNLFCDNMDDELHQQSPDQCTNKNEHLSVTATLSDGLLENVYCNVSPMQQTHYTRPVNHLTDSTLNVNSVTSTIVDDILTNSDPNLHVYSNINNASTLNTAANQSPQKVSDIFTLDKSNTLNTKMQANKTSNEIMEFTNNIGSILSQSMSNQSSTMLSENMTDLDLDDPTLLSGSITSPTNMPITTDTQKTNDISNDMANRRNKSFASTDDIRLHLSKNIFGNGKSHGDITDANQSVFDSQHLRSLHDTTMIDCALDLDSLEDATTVINSQINPK